MTDHYRVLHIGTSRLLPAAIRKEVDVPYRLKQTETICEILRAICMNDINEMRIGDIQLPRLLPEQMMPEERRRWVQARYPTQQQIPPL